MRNLNEHNITDAVVQRFGDTPNPRLKELVTSLVRHLHAFARETKLTEEEWLAGIRFLTRTGQMCSDKRQEFILLSDTLGLSQLVVAQNHSRSPQATEQTVFGPFHLDGAPEFEQGADIARGAKGEPCFVNGIVRGTDGRLLTGAKVDIWQADAEGFYDVQHAEWDEMKLRGVLRTDAEGRFRFRTVKPLSYPIPTDGPVGDMLKATKRHPMRPGHIHFMIDAPGYDKLITHIFIEEDEWLDSDAVFGVRSSCIGDYAQHKPGTAPDGSKLGVPFYTLDYQFVLQKL